MFVLSVGWEIEFPMCSCIYAVISVSVLILGSLVVVCGSLAKDSPIEPCKKKKISLFNWCR